MTHDQAGQALPSREGSSEGPDSSTKASATSCKAALSDLEAFNRSQSVPSLQGIGDIRFRENFRARIRWVVEHAYFEWAIAFLIVVSSVLLTLDRPSLEQESFEVRTPVATVGRESERAPSRAENLILAS